jgi:hypothetical protein
MSPITPPGITYPFPYTSLLLIRPRSATPSLPFSFAHARPKARLPVSGSVGFSGVHRLHLHHYSVQLPGHYPAIFLDFDSGVAPTIFRHTSILQTCILYHSHHVSLIAQYHKANSRMRDCPVALFGYGKNKSILAFSN